MATDLPRYDAKALKSDSPTRDPEYGSITAGATDEAILPAGTLDPVYEAKAKVLNRAVRASRLRAAVVRDG